MFFFLHCFWTLWAVLPFQFSVTLIMVRIFNYVVGVSELTSQTQDTSSQIDPFFNNLKFEMSGLPEEIEQVN